MDNYASTTKTDFQSEMDLMVTASLQDRLIKLGVNSHCPHCGSDRVVKCGKRKRIQVLQCKDCSKKFTPFTDTILEKTRWHWGIWIKVLEMTVNNYSIQSMVNVLEDDFGCVGINPKTVWLWRMKLIHALASIPQPKLTDIIQVDETFVRESQKSSRELVPYLGKDVDRQPRYGRKPSKFGVMGPEFATVVAAVDNRGYCVCKVSSLGKLTPELFVDLFEKHFDNPAFLYTDANNVYEHYCSLFKVSHYEKTSKYIDVIEKAGYEYPNHLKPSTIPATETHNRKLLEKLYNEDLIDRITNMGTLKYEQFAKLKEKHDLSLGRVNQLHADIKDFIYGRMTNVSTKYLADYIGFFTYIRN